MNKQRRRDIERATNLLAEAVAIIATALDEERGAYENLPESLQTGASGQRLDETADAIEEAKDALEDVIRNLVEVLERN